MSSRNAVTFSGKPPSVSRRSRSVHSASTACVAACSRSTRLGSSDRVSLRATAARDAGSRPSRRCRCPQNRSRVGERALERVVARQQRGSELVEVGVQRLEAAAVELRERRLARTRWIDARFFGLASVSSSVPFSKSNAASPILPGSAWPAFLPVQAPGDHQVQHQEQLVVELERRCACRSAARPAALAVARRQRRGRRCAAGTGWPGARARTSGPRSGLRGKSR